MSEVFVAFFTLLWSTWDLLTDGSRERIMHCIWRPYALCHVLTRGQWTPRQASLWCHWTQRPLCAGCCLINVLIKELYDKLIYYGWASQTQNRPDSKSGLLHFGTAVNECEYGQVAGKRQTVLRLASTRQYLQWQCKLNSNLNANSSIKHII